MLLSRITMPKVVIVGATSGIGKEIARQLLAKGWKLGVAGRRTELLKELKATSPQSVHIRRIDVRNENASNELLALIADLGGMDLYIHCSGVGSQNTELDSGIELNTVATNVDGFVRLVDCAFSYFAEKEGGHICIISSIAGTKGLGASCAYSASKAFQNTYLDALEQLSVMRKCRIAFTDVRPGFVDTDLLHDGKSYPMKMSVEKVAAAIVNGIETRKRVLVIDWRYRLLVFFWSLVPQWLWKRLPIKS